MTKQIRTIAITLEDTDNTQYKNVATSRKSTHSTLPVCICVWVRSEEEWLRATLFKLFICLIELIKNGSSQVLMFCPYRLQEEGTRQY